MVRLTNGSTGTITRKLTRNTKRIASAKMPCSRKHHETLRSKRWSTMCTSLLWAKQTLRTVFRNWSRRSWPRKLNSCRIFLASSRKQEKLSRNILTIWSHWSSRVARPSITRASLPTRSTSSTRASSNLQRSCRGRIVHSMAPTLTRSQARLGPQLAVPMAKASTTSACKNVTF